MGVKKWGNDVLDLFHATRVMEEDCQDSAKDNKDVNLGAGREGIDDEEAAGVKETEVLGRERKTSGKGQEREVGRGSYEALLRRALQTVELIPESKAARVSEYLRQLA